MRADLNSSRHAQSFHGDGQQPNVMDCQGLTSVHAAQRLLQDGPNALDPTSKVSGLSILLEQFKSPVLWVLLGAGLLSFALGEVADVLTITAIVAVNTLVGFFQEFRAHRAIASLHLLSAPRANVIRDSEMIMISAREVVVGDVLVIEAGDVVAADASVFESHQLSVNESILTGESASVTKLASSKDGDERSASAMLFMGTHVVTGSGKARVYATGRQTELGKIAHLVATAQPGPTPLQTQLSKISVDLLRYGLLVAAIVTVLSWSHGRPWSELIMAAVSLVVAVIPEGLPALVTIALAIGVRRLTAAHVLVRKLVAVETLGSATVICTDKTGTLTSGVMKIREVWGADPALILRHAASVCDAQLTTNEKPSVGDPTELAILEAAAEYDIFRPEIEKAQPRLAVVPFDAKQRWMAILRRESGLFVKGAPEAIFPLCRTIPHQANDTLAQWAIRGLRVLAIAHGTGPAVADLDFIGLVGIADPPRTSVAKAILQAKRAGIRTIMITGDHPTTALAIAREIGLIDGQESGQGSVFARTSPSDKLAIVQQLKAKGEIVAMTGDGVNDAPALREAHIGIAMGMAGTEVTREAADIVLTDDDFATIVAAVAQGRTIFANIRNSLIYLLAGNAAELGLMFAAAACGLPLPFLPLQLLWINLVTDGLPALALAMGAEDAEDMQKPPRPTNQPMLGRWEWRVIALTGCLEATIVFASFWIVWQNSGLVLARTFAFSTLVFGETLRSLALRAHRSTPKRSGRSGNSRLFGIVACSIAAQFLVHYLPFARDFLSLAILSPAQWLVAFGLGIIPAVAMELARSASNHSIAQRPASVQS